MLRKAKITAMAAAAFSLGIAGAVASSAQERQVQQTANTSAHVVVQVVVQTPPGVSREAIVQGFQNAVPTYAAVPGLIRKYFTVTDTGFGGTYLFASRQAAESWFNAAWRQRVIATYGSAPVVTYFDAPVQVDGRNPTGAP
jgi:hypothetical protein